MRRSARGKSGAQEDNNDILSTPTRGSRQVADASEIAAADWSTSPSPLSSLSTPASSAVQARRNSRRMPRDGRSAMAETNMDDDSGGSGSEGNDSVDELLAKAAEVIRDKVYPAQSDDEEDEDEGETREAKRQRSSSPAKEGAHDEGHQRSGSAKAGSGRGGWWPGKRGRPPKSAAGLQRQHMKQLMEGEAGDSLDDGSDIVDDEEELDDDVNKTDEAGETKISRYGDLLGGREYICPVFQSPFRGSGQRLFVLSMDCCRFTGARDSYMLFKQHPRMRRVETTQQERDLLAERAMIPKVTRFRSIAMITARAAYREFGALLVKDGRYITDDYWEAERREEAKYPEGTMIANMSVYHKVQAAHAAGIAPGSTRQARRITPLRSPTAGPSDQPPPHMAIPPQQHIPAVSSWVQLEAQQRHAAGLQNTLQQRHSVMPQHQQPRHAGRTMASALMLAPQLLPLGEADGDSSDAANTGAGQSSSSSSKPVFRRMRAAEIAEAAFDSAASAHRAHFDDSGFVDGAPLAHSLAVSWARAPSLSNRLKHQQQKHTGDADDDVFGPMAFASGRVAREFNASVRMWRDDNGCTWVDPHTGIRQVPASLQPTCAYAQRIGATGSGTDTSVAFTDSVAEMPEPVPESYPIAVLPGQYQASFPVHRTRFGQSYQNAMNSYSYHWLRQLSQQQQQLKINQQQQQQLMMMQSSARRR